MVDDGILYCDNFHPQTLAVETNQYQQLLEKSFEEGLHKFGLHTICITPVLISLCTRCRTAPSDMPTDSAIAE